MLGFYPIGVSPLGTAPVADTSASLFEELQQGSVVDPVFLFEITSSEGLVSTPVYVPEVLGRYPLGYNPSGAVVAGLSVNYFSDRDWTEKQTEPPALDLNFAEDPFPSELTFTRSSAAWSFNASRVLTQHSSNVPRIAYDPKSGTRKGLYIEGTSTNHIRNNTMAGVSAGSPGTMPTNWSNSTLPSGVSRQIVASGTENGMEYVDIKYSGTPTSTGSFYIYHETSTGIAALAGEVMTISAFLQLIAGSFSGNPGVYLCIQANDSGGTFGSESIGSNIKTSIPSGTWTRYDHSATLA